eukprot:GHVT01063425.1.p1 GENE.GHVT01063425.1~~GHVT01063425.1.p1  ORF type:complete len:194 (+),score=47.29 GHVT01063425.1:432-1013(+)
MQKSINAAKLVSFTGDATNFVSKLLSKTLPSGGLKTLFKCFASATKVVKGAGSAMTPKKGSEPSVCRPQQGGAPSMAESLEEKAFLMDELDPEQDDEEDEPAEGLKDVYNDDGPRTPEAQVEDYLPSLAERNQRGGLDTGRDSLQNLQLNPFKTASQSEDQQIQKQSVTFPNAEKNTPAVYDDPKLFQELIFI